MAKFKLLPPRMNRAPMRIRSMNLPEQASPESDERRQLYLSPQWRRMRTQMKSRFCACGCGRYATVLDHLLGHDDVIAARVARQLGTPAAEHWRDRFFAGPFISLADPCHSRKARMEQLGQLEAWVTRWRDKTLPGSG